MDRVYDEIDWLYTQRGLDNPRQEKLRFATRNLFGIDLNERMTWVAKMNMVMHGDGHGGIFTHNGLKDTERVQSVLDIQKNRDGFDIILTNPPFGSKVTDQDILVNYKLGSNRKSQLTEVLFLERCIKLLKPTGRMGIVMPDGILTNVSLKYVRDFLRENASIEAVVSLPFATFVPYGSGVKASLLFLKKKDPLIKEKRDHGILMAVARDIGYDATGKSTDKNDLKPILTKLRGEKKV
jgi:type I restriction enzyme M protein